MAFQELMEGFKSFPAGKVKQKRDSKPDTMRGIKAQRRMDTARIAHTHELTKDEAKAAVKEREQDNKKRGLERRYKAKSADKERESKNNRLEKLMKKDSKDHPSIEEHYNNLATAYEEVLRKMHGG